MSVVQGGEMLKYSLLATTHLHVAPALHFSSDALPVGLAVGVHSSGQAHILCSRPLARAGCCLRFARAWCRAPLLCDAIAAAVAAAAVIVAAGWIVCLHVVLWELPLRAAPLVWRALWCVCVCG
jgi:hypothetical protein